MQDELRDIASDAAKKYFLLTDAAVEGITLEEVKEAIRKPPHEAPMFAHMMMKFTDSQIKSNAREASERGLLNVNIGTINLPPRMSMDELNVIDVEAVEAEEKKP